VYEHDIGCGECLPPTLTRTGGRSRTSQVISAWSETRSVPIDPGARCRQPSSTLRARLYGGQPPSSRGTPGGAAGAGGLPGIPRTRRHTVCVYCDHSRRQGEIRMRRLATGGRGSSASGLAAVLVLTVAACASKSSADGLDLRTPSASPSAASRTVSPAPTPSTEKEKILAQYRRFWATLTPASVTAGSHRLQMLRAVSTEPSLSRTAGGMHTADAIGEVGYGVPQTHPQITKVAGEEAWLRDCLDASNVGRVKVTTGRKTTRGTTHDLAVVSMRRGDDNVWRVSTVDLSFPPHSC
jgi:hypothetical protein